MIGLWLLFVAAPTPDVIRPTIAVSGVPIEGVEAGAVDEAALTVLLTPLGRAHADLTTSPSDTSINIEATATSHSTWRDKVYGPANVLDLDFRTAWVEGRRGHGIGQSLVLRVTPRKDTGRSLRGLIVLPGYAKSPGMWSRNNRPRSLALAIGEHRWTLAFDDARRWQIFLLPRGISLTETAVVAMTITAVYAGSHYRDTSIAEVRLLFW